MQASFRVLANGYLNQYIRRDYAAALALFTRAADMAEDAEILEAIADVQVRLGNYEFGIDYLDRALELDRTRSDLMWRAASHSRFIRRYDKVLTYSIRAHAVDSTEMSPCGIADLQLHIDWNTERARQTLANAPGSVEHCHVLDFYDRRFQLLLDHHDAGEDIWSAYMLEVYRQRGLQERRAEIFEVYKSDAEEGDVAPKINKFGFLAIGEAGLGNRDEALVALDSFRVNVTRDRGVTLSNYNTFAAIVYLWLDMYDELFEVLEVEASRPGFMNVVWLRFPWFDPVRDKPRFQDIMKKFEAWERPDDG